LKINEAKLSLSVDMQNIPIVTARRTALFLTLKYTLQVTVAKSAGYWFFMPFKV